MDKKYKFSDEREKGLYRIIALRDIPRHNVKAGDRGGRVNNKRNLSHEGDCWIECNAVVCGDAFVRDDAIVRDNAIVLNHTYAPIKVCGNAVISGNAWFSSGTWKTTPKVIKGSAYDVIYNAKQIAIGCECHSLKWWKKYGLALAKKDYFTPEQIEEYREYLNTIKKEYADDKEV